MSAGAQEIQRLIVRLQADMSQYKKELEAATLLTTKNATKMELACRSLSKQFDVWGTKMKHIGRSMSTYVTMPIMAFAGYGVKAFADFDKAMVESLSIMDTTAEQAQRMRDMALDLSTKAPKGPEELAKSYYFLASAGLNAEQSLGAMPVVMKFATAGAFDMATATDLLTDAQTAFGMEMDAAGANMTKLANAIVRTEQLANASSQQFAEAMTSDAGVAARNFGMELETLMGVLAAYASSGKKAAEAGNLMGRATRLLTSAYREHGTVFKKYGIEVVDKATGEYRNFIDIIADMEKAFAKLTKPQLGAALEELGFEALAQKSLLPLIGMSEQMKKWEADVRSSTTAMNDVFEKQMQAFSNQVKMLWNEIKVAAIEIGAVMVPMLKSLMEQVKAGVQWFKGLTDEQKEFAVKAALVVAAIGPMILLLGRLSTALSVLTKSVVATKAGLVGLALVGIAVVSKAIYDAMPSIRAFNAELEKASKLGDEWAKKTASAWQETDQQLAELNPKDRVKAVEAEIERLRKEEKGHRGTVELQAMNIAKLRGEDADSKKGWGTGVVTGMWRKAVHATVGHKTIGFHEAEMEEAQKRANEFQQRRIELEKQLTQLKEQQGTLDKAAEVDKGVKLQEAREGLKKLKETWNAFSWKATFAFDKVEKKGANAFKVLKKKAGEVWDKWAQGDPSFRVNMAVRGDSMEGLRAKEATAAFVAENKEKKVNDERQKQQVEFLKQIATNTKKILTPYSGIRDLVGLFTKK